ncbi:serine hydrolase domain-containing protein [Evansella halocellulosilytica]|uniref:serine hydrolase domain-containing protein n=1 Tax=Evansella halocellulosilytica TaxID=2011013 RepID=UPI00211C374E|nr:serine hydrolase [Evansella halocellulosilytica]
MKSDMIEEGFFFVTRKGLTAVIFGILILIIGVYIIMIQSPQIMLFSSWESYDSPEDAGWSSEKLDDAKDYYQSINSTSAMAIYKGKVLFTWGNVAKNTNAHSVRKSFLSSLYGIYESRGDIHLQSTLDELNIDDRNSLTALERTAIITDLLSSSSGVYHTAGEESWTMRRARPHRGSHPPGTNFYYNNWDFNVLGTIFNEQTDNDLFRVFYEEIADPLEMEDFSLNNTKYKHELRRSVHPSYLFQISTRDMARFGQLYLQEGEWNGEQIIPKEWIQKSTKPQAEVAFNDVYDYGYMWWPATEGYFAELDMYSAIGRYGQSIDIIPALDLVFVHRVDSNSMAFGLFNRGVSQDQRLTLLKKVVDAKK